MGTNTLLPLVTIIPALIGSGLISAGFIIHPLITINPKERGLTSKDISIWQRKRKRFEWPQILHTHPYSPPPPPMYLCTGSTRHLRPLFLLGS